MEEYTYADMKKSGRTKMSDKVPLELYRMIRLIGMNQGLPMGGKGTTLTVGRKIGESLPVTSVAELLKLFEDLQIGIPSVMYEDDKKMRIAIDDCFCKGLPQIDEKKVCDLEGAILEGALMKILKRKVVSKEILCNVSGDDHCEYEIRLLD